MSRSYMLALKALWIVVLGGFVLALAGSAVSAQSSSDALLANGGLELPYYGEGNFELAAPEGWQLWVAAGTPRAIPQTRYVVDGKAAWKFYQPAGESYAMAAWQTVTGLQKGALLRFTASGFVYACDDVETVCQIDGISETHSNVSAGIFLKVGIDPEAGSDPFSPVVVWSASVSPFDQWTTLTTTAVTEKDTITVFLFAAQSQGPVLNGAYWDAVSLTVEAPAAIDGPLPYSLFSMNPEPLISD